MAEPNQPGEIDKLLAEVERSLSGKPAVPAERAAPETPQRRGRGMRQRVRTPALAGAGAAVVVWVLFAVLPFLHAGSGAVGAFAATFVAMVLLPRR
jgi:ferric-dicitrate binding protein FerR (iron transport regulator)